MLVESVIMTNRRILRLSIVVLIAGLSMANWQNCEQWGPHWFRAQSLRATFEFREILILTFGLVGLLVSFYRRKAT